MSDVVREFIEMTEEPEMTGFGEHKKNVLDALDAEREAHAAELNRLRNRLREAILLLQDKGTSQSILERLED